MPANRGVMRELGRIVGMRAAYPGAGAGREGKDGQANHASSTVMPGLTRAADSRSNMPATGYAQ